MTQTRPTANDTWVGYYGCASRLVRIMWTGSTALRKQAIGHASAHKQTHQPITRRPATTWTVNCPACGNKHRVDVSWRTLNTLDSDFQADLILPTHGVAT